jgi:DNA-binding MarR family transcriptional regulator
MGKIKLNENEVKVLGQLVEYYEHNEDFAYVSFAPLIRDLKLDRAAVRRACRSLKRKGLATFLTGLITEDGEFAGAGYSATEEGAKLLNFNRESEDEEQDSLFDVTPMVK